jgi:HK97 family phage prohead protease
MTTQVHKSTMLRAIMPAQINVLGEREVEVVVSTGNRARDGHVFEPSGGHFDNYGNNPIVLWQHDVMSPIGNGNELRVEDNGIRAKVVFAPVGIDATADRICGLVKSGVVRGISFGVDPIEAEPLDPAKPKGGKRVTSWELLEFSFCSVPVDPDALVTNRSQPNKGNEVDTNDGNTAGAPSVVRAKHTRALQRAPAHIVFKRGLYDVASLAYLLESVGYAHSTAEWEKEYEGDDSEVPAMIGEALQKLGAAMVAMTAEEVAELLAMHGQEPEGETDEERALKPAQRAWRRGMVMCRAGKSVSAANKEKLEDADGHLKRAMKHHAAIADHHGAVGDGIKTCRALHEDLGKAHKEMGDALDAASDDDGDGEDGVKRCMRAHKSIGKALDKMGDAHADMDDKHQDAGDSHNGCGRAIKSASRCMRAVVEGTAPGSEEDDGKDDDSQDVQTSAGTGESGGSSNDRSMDADFRRRQSDLLRLRQTA